MVLLCSAGCSSARVKWFAPVVEPIVRSANNSGKSRIADVERLYAQAVQAEKKEDEKCVDLFYQVAAATYLSDGPSCSQCRRTKLHKSALIKLVTTAQRFKRLDPRRGLTLQPPINQGWLPISYSGFAWKPDDFHYLIPVGSYFTKTIDIYRSAGLGIPIVVLNCQAKKNSRFLPSENTFDATLRMTSVGGVFRLEMFNPRCVDSATLNSMCMPLAKDNSASIAYSLQNERSTILNNFIYPESPSELDGLQLLEPYQPGKIPVVLIHGLLSSPYTWARMVNELRATPKFTDRFQIWIFQYATGKPFLTSARELRVALSTARATFDPLGRDSNLSDMVLIGHSMGGLISKLQVTSSGNKLWRSVSNRRFDQVQIPETLQNNIYNSFFFEASPDVSRVIFIATPHHGSRYANRLIGRIGSSLVRPSDRDAAAHRELIQNNPGVFTREIRRRIPTSIDLLEPDSGLLNAVRCLPASDHVQMHSVIGNRSGSCLFGHSDGVVSIESAKEPRAISERYVNASHSKSKDHPDTIAEVRAILNQHWVDRYAHSVKPDLRCPRGRVMSK